MQAFFLLTLAVAALASASPIVQSCSRAKPAKLYLQSSDSQELVPVALTNYKSQDEDGNYSSVLVTETVDGSAVAPAKFDFASCSSAYVQTESQPLQAGHISAYGETGYPKRCLASAESNSSHSVFTNSICPTSDGESQVHTFFEWSGLDTTQSTSQTSSLSPVKFLGAQSYQEQVLTISQKQGENGAVQLWSSAAEAPQDSKLYRFVLSK